MKQSLKIYRYKSRQGWYVMINAADDADALEVARQRNKGATTEDLEVWNSDLQAYQPI